MSARCAHPELKSTLSKMIRKSQSLLLLAVAVSFGAVPVHAKLSGVAALKEREKRVKAVVSETMGATIAIEGSNFASGSGVIVSSDGLILTAAHVTAAAGQDLTVTFPDGRTVRARSLGANSSRDAGMAKIIEEGGSWPFVEIGAPEDVELGEWCVALGHPGGYDPNRTPPVRLGRVWTKQFMGMLGTDCTLVGGDSGGPLFDLEGRLIGIHSSIGGQLSQNRHVPMDAFLEDWDDLLGGKLWGSQSTMMGGLDPDRPAMGVRLDDEFEGGVKVAGLSDSSPAGRAGIEVGDVILRIGDREVGDFNDMVGALERLKAGDRVKVGVARGQERLEFEIKLGRLGKLWELDDEPEEAEQPGGDAPVRGRASLGVQLERDAEGAKVFEVVPGSAAEKAGIQAGDVILKVDDEAVGSAAEMAENISGRTAGDRISITLQSGEEEKQLEVTLDGVGR